MLIGCEQFFVPKFVLVVVIVFLLNRLSPQGFFHFFGFKKDRITATKLVLVLNDTCHLLLK